MSFTTLLAVAALVVAIGSCYFQRRATKAAERSAAEAARSASAATEVAGAAMRSASASETSAATAADALAFAKLQAENVATEERKRWLDGLVREGVEKWERLGQLTHIFDREPSLTRGEIESLVFRVFGGLGKSDRDARQYLENVRGGSDR